VRQRRNAPTLAATLFSAQGWGDGGLLAAMRAWFGHLEAPQDAARRNGALPGDRDAVFAEHVRALCILAGYESSAKPAARELGAALAGLSDAMAGDGGPHLLAAVFAVGRAAGRWEALEAGPGGIIPTRGAKLGRANSARTRTADARTNRQHIEAAATRLWPTTVGEGTKAARIKALSLALGCEGFHRGTSTETLRKLKSLD
jgi:hypothetical protein